MKHLIAAIFVLLPLRALAAPDIRGIWQAEGSIRHVLKIAQDKGHLTARFYDLGQDAAPMDVTGISLVGAHFKMLVLPRASQLNGAFEGTLSADGRSLAGVWGKNPMTFVRANPKDAWPVDPSPHRIRFVTVQPDVKLEVLDWGGDGPPLIFLAGLGNTAHVFDELASHFTANHHVYGITRRGIGASSLPPTTDENYNADRLGDEVLAVMEALKIDKPVLAGHSIAGEELSSVGTRHPEKVSGLIYLDAAYAQGYYDPDGYSLTVDVDVVRRDLFELPKAGVSPIRSRALIAEMQAVLPNLQKSMANYAKELEGLPEYPPVPQNPQRAAMDAVDGGERRYGPVSAPTLAIFAVPPACKPDCDTASNREYTAQMVRQADAFAAGNPAAKIVRLPYADHYVFRSNEAEVLAVMNGFMDSLH